MDLTNLEVFLTVLLAAAATLGYLFARRARAGRNNLDFRSHGELRRAQQVAAELEKIAWNVRKGLARHHAALTRFKEQISRLSACDREAAWKGLCREADQVLKPTLRLAAQMAGAYDEIRQQTANLTAFTEVRSDPLTGLQNRRGLDDALAAQFALMCRYGTPFSVAILDIDHFKQINDREGHLHGDRILRRLAHVLQQSVRETDVVARYGGEEFVVVMPQTALEGVCIFAERLRQKVEQETTVTLSGGVAVALDGDSAETLLARADAALYSAKSAGRNCIHRHNGHQAEPAVEAAPSLGAPAGI